MQKQYLENAEHLEKSLNAKLEGLFLVMTLQFFLATLKVGQPFEMKYLRAYIRIIKQLTLFKPGCARLPSGLTFRSSRPAFGGRLSFFVRVIRVFYCFWLVRYGKSHKQCLYALQGCFVPQGALMLVVLI